MYIERDTKKQCRDTNKQSNNGDKHIKQQYNSKRIIEATQKKYSKYNMYTYVLFCFLIPATK